MLKYPLIHPEILAALASAGHGSRVLVADANYPSRTATGPHTRIVHLNLRPGLVSVEDVLSVLTTAVTVEDATVMLPDGGPEPAIFGLFRRLLPEVTFSGVSRQEFYSAARSEDVALLVATGEQQLYANILMTLGIVGS